VQGGPFSDRRRADRQIAPGYEGTVERGECKQKGGQVSLPVESTFEVAGTGSETEHRRCRRRAEGEPVVTAVNKLRSFAQHVYQCL
jgi:hypothetical protein